MIWHLSTYQVGTFPSGPAFQVPHRIFYIGVIASIGPDGRESDIAEVERLVGDFIKNPHCLILLAISCETDPENQRGRHLVRQYDEAGERTIRESR